MPNFAYAEECAEHQWSEWYTFSEATCSMSGSLYRICAICNERESQIVPATGQHDWSEWYIFSEATCSMDGYLHRNCKVCYKTENQIIPATGQHDWSEWYNANEPTCGYPGLMRRTCSVCSRTEDVSIPKTTNHDWDDWETTRKATALSTGIKARQCLECGDIQTKVIPKLKAKVSLAKKTVTIQKGKSYTLKIKSKTYGDKTARWSSGNKKIATISSKGKVTGKKIGTTTITLKMKSGAKSSCKVKVTKAKIGNNNSDSNDDDPPASGYVWIPKTGSKYHKTSTCSGMKSPRKVTLKEAKRRGYKPCSKCY